MAASKSNDSTSFSAGYALIIGTGTDIKGNISKRYRSTINDAEWVAQVLKESTLCAFREDQVKVLVGEEATRERIIAALDSLKEMIISDDIPEATVVVFFSGHGLRFKQNTYLLPYGFNASDQLATHAIGGELLYEKLQVIGADKVLLLLNACYSGGVMPKLGDGDDQSLVLQGPLNAKQIKLLSRGTGFALLSSSQPSQTTLTGYLANHSHGKRYSPFTIGLCRGFAGKDMDKGDGLVYFNDLQETCAAYVTIKTKDAQRTHWDIKGANFPVGIHNAGVTRSREFPLLGDDVVFDVESDTDLNTEKTYCEEEALRRILGEQRVQVAINKGNLKVRNGPGFVGNITIGNNLNNNYK